MSSLDTGIKTPVQKDKEKLTEWEKNEIVRCAMDVDYFVQTYVKVQHPVKGTMPLVLFDFQQVAMDNLKNYKHNIVLFSRQMGKTTIIAAYLLWFDMFQKDKTVLITAHNQKGAIEILDRIKFAYKELPDFLKEAVLEFNKLSITFDNGSRIVCRATSADAARGLSPSLIYIDEMEFIRPSIASAFYTAIRPTISTGGSSIISSTPGSDESLFAELWRGSQDVLQPDGSISKVGRNGYKSSYAIFSDHPDRDENFEKNERAVMGDLRFEREHMNKFLSIHETLIDPLALERYNPIDPKYKTGEVRWFKEIDYMSSYYVCLDPSLGTASDWSAIEIVEVPSMEQVGEWSSNVASPTDQVSMLLDILNYIADELDLDMEDFDLPIYWSFENNGVGAAILQIVNDLGTDVFPGRLVSDKRTKQMGKTFVKGLNTTNKNKLLGCAKMKSLIEADKITINSRGLISQLKNFGPKGSSYAAKSGNDDLVMSFMMVIRMLELTKNWDVFDADLIRDDIQTEFREPLSIVF